MTQHLERAFPALPITHPVSLAAEVLALAAKQRAARRGSPVAPPVELEMPGLALEPALRASNAVRALVIPGTQLAVFAWNEAAGIRLAVSHRNTGRTYSARIADTPAVARLEAYAASLIAAAIGPTPLRKAA